MEVKYCSLIPAQSYNELLHSVSVAYVDYFSKYGVEGQSIHRFIAETMPVVMDLATDGYMLSLSESDSKTCDSCDDIIDKMMVIPGEECIVIEKIGRIFAEFFNNYAWGYDEQSIEELFISKFLAYTLRAMHTYELCYHNKNKVDE